MDSLSVKNLSYSYKNTPVLSNIDFNIKNGQIISIVGPYGCGKTTLLKLLAGILSATSGKVDFEKNGTDNKTVFGYCFQGPSLLPWLSALDNIMLPQKISNSLNKRAALDLLKLANLSDKAQFKPNELSGGTQKIVSILQSLILNPAILLLDEPFSSIDELNREILQDQLLSIHKTLSNSIILITHSISEAVYLSDKIIVLSDKPARIKKILTIDIKRNGKTRQSDKFFKYVNLLREIAAK